MQILLANAKIMVDPDKALAVSVPRFQSVADRLALEMASLDIDALARQLDCSRKLAAENWVRYQHFFTASKRPALFAYYGQAYKHLRADTLSEDALQFGQQHLWITCFLYGLLRPLDGIVPYRMEHCVTLEATGNQPVNRFWRDKLTDVLIESVKADDGLLIHLATAEYEQLFDWPRVRQEVRVIQPLFYVRKQEKLQMQAVWAKTGRGAMTHFILANQLTDPTGLQAFRYSGFAWDPRLGDADFPHFVKEGVS